ncbi:MAG: hypothetical protein V4690_01765 [Patescibacteria group bacterium]
MNTNNDREVSLDILRHIEVLSDKVNKIMARGTRSVFSRYPLTFALLILVGVVAVSEGLKTIVVNLSFFDGHPWRLLAVGLVILVGTGTLYKKLDK